ncbi:replication/maintenance protein RepL [bacterium]|nr:replication/maintenance protein RepL [bacterium]
MNDETWVKIYRKLVDWEWYKDVPCKTLFIHLILIAQYKKTRHIGLELKAGETITGFRSLANETGLSVQQVRTALKKLESTNDIKITTNPTHTIISLNNWHKYQSSQRDEDRYRENKSYNAFA